MKPLLLIQKDPLNLAQGYKFALAAVVSFHLAYGLPGCQWFMVLFLYCMFRLANLPSGWLAFCFGLGIGLAVYTPHLFFFWTLFGPAALALWLVLPFWLGIFLLAGRACLVRFGPVAWAVAAPFFWSGLEYFRSELYYLRFSWLNPGYAFSDSASLPFMAGFGVYGIGFLLMAWAAFAGVVMQLTKKRRIVAAVVLVAASTLPLWLSTNEDPDITTMYVTGIQLEGAPTGQIKSALDAALLEYPQTQLFVLSEYAFDGPIPPEILGWCKEHGKWLAAGGKDPISAIRFYNSVFVASPDGTIVFRQAKSVPLQFMKDGVRAPEQSLWESPWGKLGFAICCDASYTRVTDELVRQGAEALIIPAMDHAEWDKAEHELDGRIAPMRAAEYSVPIFRLASSGISQFVKADGRVASSAPFPGQGAMLNAKMELTLPGRIPLGCLVAQLSLVVFGTLVLFMLVEAWWAPVPPEP